MKRDVKHWQMGGGGWLCIKKKNLIMSSGNTMLMHL